MASVCLRGKVLLTAAQRNFTCRTIFTSFANLSSIETTKDNSVIPSGSLHQGDLNLVSGIPEEQIAERKITIYLPSRNAMQSGTHNMRKWSISFDTKQRWENPLMGWASSGDPLSNTQIQFNTREAAVAYCQSHGWNYEIVEPTLPKTRPKSYGANFAWNKRTRVSTK